MPQHLQIELEWANISTYQFLVIPTSKRWSTKIIQRRWWWVTKKKAWTWKVNPHLVSTQINLKPIKWISLWPETKSLRATKGLLEALVNLSLRPKSIPYMFLLSTTCHTLQSNIYQAFTKTTRYYILLLRTTSQMNITIRAWNKPPMFTSIKSALMGLSG